MTRQAIGEWLIVGGIGGLAGLWVGFWLGGGWRR